ncbi:type VI secretion system tube protein Hcp, partial [Bacillus cereus]
MSAVIYTLTRSLKMPTPCYISITGQTQGNITAGA